MILVGTKIDLRNAKEGEPQKQFDPVTEEEGKAMKESIKV